MKIWGHTYISVKFKELDEDLNKLQKEGKKIEFILPDTKDNNYLLVIYTEEDILKEE